MVTFGNISSATTAANRLDQTQIHQALQVSVGGVVDHIEAGSAPSISNGTFRKDVSQNLFLTFV